MAASALALAACGDEETETPTEADAAATPELAIEEIDATLDGLEASLGAYQAGDAVEAEQLAGDAYLEHFEIVEGPLEEVDPELNESLEELIREELRAAIANGEPVAEVKALVNEAASGLDEATAALEESSSK